MSEWVDIPLAVQQGEGSSTYVSDSELKNLMLKENPAESRARFHVASVPTLSTSNLGALPGSGMVRGVCVQNQNAAGLKSIWMIRGTGIHYTNSLSTWSTLAGTMPNASERCRMADCGDYVVAVDGTNTRVFSAAGVTTTPSIETFYDVTYQDGYTIYAKANGTGGTQDFYVSSLDDPTTIGALDFTSADALPGYIVGLVSKNREIFVLTSASIQHFYNAGGSGFPFVRGSPGLVEGGVIFNGAPRTGANSIAKLDEALFWLGHDRRVYMMRGYTPEPISSPWIERFIAANVVDSHEFFGNAFVLEGRQYYMLSGFSNGQLGQPGTTEFAIVYDVKNGVWHVRNSPITADLRILYALRHPWITATGNLEVVVFAEDRSSTAPAVYWLDPAGTNDSGASGQTNRVMTLPQFAPGGGARRVSMPELYVDMQKADAATTVTLSWSDDGGTTYTSGVSGTANNGRMRFQRLGAFYQRILRLTFSVASAINIVGIRARIEVADA